MSSHTVAGNIVVFMSDNESLMARSAADEYYENIN